MNHHHLAFLLPLFSFVVGCSDSGASSSGLPECDSSQSTTMFTAGDVPLPPGGFLQCLARSPEISPQTGSASCLILELTNEASPDACACDAANGRAPLSAEHQGAKDVAVKAAAAQGKSFNCFCEIVQLVDTDGRSACQNVVQETPVDMANNPIKGFCYIDATTTPVTGNPELVASCPETEKRGIRVLGDPAVTPSASIMTICSESDCN
jgi:hypothetical protein